MLISTFVFLSGGTQSKQEFIPQGYEPTATPTPSNTANPRPGVTSSTRDFGSLHQNIVPDYQQTNVRGAGLIEASSVVTNGTWKLIAANAWKYFQPGTGVDSTTGLPGAGLGYPYFTDWDLGVYIQACIDAQKLNLTSTGGDWGSYARLEKVLKFLENRELNSTTHYPFWFYQAGNGQNWREKSDTSKFLVDGVDTGRLFVALNNLKIYNPSWSTRIDNFVYNKFGNRSNYAAIIPDAVNDCLTSTSIYTYYVASGFASFWPQVNPSKVLDNMQKAGNVTTNGVSLPKATISCDPLLCSVFELNSNPKLTALVKQVYLAHEARYNANGQFVAFSEGNSDIGFIYEWVVLPNGTTWAVTSIDLTPIAMNPIVYNKVVYGFLALYNTSYARETAIYLERCFQAPTRGYPDGADYTQDPISRELVEQVGGNSNGLILGAAKYALKL